MNTIVTGASGFVGRRLCKNLLEYGWNVIGVFNQQRPPEDLLNHSLFQPIQRNLSVSGFSKAEVDGVDMLFHLAGTISIDDGEDVGAFLKNNEMASLNVFESCMPYIKRVVYASSQVVYGDPNSLTVDENFPLIGYNTPYACSKVNCENWLRWFQMKYHSITYVLRLTGFIEYSGSVISYFISRAMANQPIEVFSNGNICRDYLSLNDCINAFILVAKLENEKPGYYEFNIGSGQAVKTGDIAKLVCNLLGSDSNIIPISTPAPRENFVFNIEKARNELKYSPASLKDNIVSYIMSLKNDYSEMG